MNEVKIKLNKLTELNGELYALKTQDSLFSKVHGIFTKLFLSSLIKPQQIVHIWNDTFCVLTIQCNKTRH